MANEERSIPGLLEDVDESELGQLRPGYTPYNPELQSWNRGRSLGLGSDSYQVGRSSHLPEFTELESEDLSAAAREIAGHLRQVELDSRDQVKLDNREQHSIQREPDAPAQQHEVTEVAKELQQAEVSLDSIEVDKLDTRQQGLEQQKDATPTQSQEPQERELTQNKEQEKEYER